MRRLLRISATGFLSRCHLWPRRRSGLSDAGCYRRERVRTRRKVPQARQNRDGTKDEKNGSKKDFPGKDLLSDEAKLEQLISKIIKKSISSQESSGATAI